MKRKDFCPNWKNIDAKYNWVGVDADGKVFAYKDKPLKHRSGSWLSDIGQFEWISTTAEPDNFTQFLYERPKEKKFCAGGLNGTKIDLKDCNICEASWQHEPPINWKTIDNIIDSVVAEQTQKTAQSNWIDYADELPPFDERVLFCGDNYKEAIIASLIELIKTSKGKYIVVQFEDGSRSKYNMDNEKTYWHPLPKK